VLNFYWFWLMIKGLLRRISIKKEDLGKRQFYKVQ
jgi:hypothetical protein